MVYLKDILGYQIEVDTKGKFSAYETIQKQGYSQRISVVEAKNLFELEEKLKKMHRFEPIPAIFIGYVWPILGAVTSVKETKDYGGRKYLRFSYKEDEQQRRAEVLLNSGTLFHATEENLALLKRVESLLFQITQIENSIDQLKGMMKGQVELPKEASQ